MSKWVRPIVWVVASECLAVATLVILTSIHPRIDTISILCGGLVFVIPNSYFTVYAFRYFRMRNVAFMPLVTQMFYRGQMGKIVLTAVGFALVFSFYPSVSPVALFASFCAMMFFHVLVARCICNQLDNA